MDGPTEYNAQWCLKARTTINDLTPSYRPTRVFPNEAANEARQAVEWVLSAIEQLGPQSPDHWTDELPARIALALERAATSQTYAVSTDDFDVYAAAKRLAFVDQMALLAGYFGASLTHPQAEVVYALLENYEGPFSDLLTATPAALA